MPYPDEIQDAPPYPMIDPIQDAPAIPLRDPALNPYYGAQPGELEARGSIAPFVDEFGTVHSTGYDSQRADMEAQTMARRFKGAQLYQSLVSGGATPQEAFRLAAPDLLFNDVKAQIKAISGLPKQPFVPRMIDVGGVKMIQRSPNESIVAPRSIPPEAVASKKATEVNKANLAAAQRDVDRAKRLRDSIAVKIDEFASEEDKKKADLSIKAVMDAEKRLADLQGAYTQTSQEAPQTVPQGTVVQRTPAGIFMGNGPQNPTSDKVIVSKDGKRFNLPKSQLEQARKEGYKLVQ